MEAAQELAYHCLIPGISEAAAAVSILVTLFSDGRDLNSGYDANLKHCRSIVSMLERASKLAGKVGLRGRKSGFPSCGLICSCFSVTERKQSLRPAYVNILHTTTRVKGYHCRRNNPPSPLPPSATVQCPYDPCMWLFCWPLRRPSFFSKGTAGCTVVLESHLRLG